MKKILPLLLLILAALSTWAQAPEAFKFQSVIRDGSGELLPNQEVALKFLLHEDAPDGTMVYSEQHQVSTNPSGLVNMQIGNGEVLSGDFAFIRWGSHEYFLEEQIAIGNTGDFQVFGTVQLLSVPYALHAKTAGNGIQNMTTEERDAVESPPVGMQIYNTTTNCLNYWSGSNWFETCGDCTPQPSVAQAGTDQSYFDSTTVAVLNGNIPGEGTGVWTKNTSYPGWFDDPNNPATAFHGEPCRSYYLKWTISTSCGSKFDYVKITFDDTPSQAVAGADILINSSATSISLAAEVPENGMGAWTVLTGEGGGFDDATNPTAVFTGADCESYSLLWEVSTECHANTDTLNVEFYAIPTTAFAGYDTIINDENLTISLNANIPEVGSGQWSILSGQGGTFADASNAKTEFTAQACETYILLWEIATACENAVDTLIVDFFTLPTTADAGVDQPGLSGTWTTLAANTPEIGTGQWTILSGEGGQITNPNSPTSVFLGQNMMLYELEWKIVSQCDTARDDVNIAFGVTHPPFNCGDSLVDDRDGQEYATVQIGEQCWMAENLNVGERIDGGVNMTDNGVIEKYCYDDDPTNCNIYGGLYKWDEIKGYDSSVYVKGICPDGWTLPSYIDFKNLIEYCGGDSIAGGKLKSTGTLQGGNGLWNEPNTGATDEYLFSGLPSGIYDLSSSYYDGLSETTAYPIMGPDSYFFFVQSLSYDSETTVRTTIYNGVNGNSFAISTRCIKNESQVINSFPNLPTNPNPSNSAINISDSIVLSWSCSDPDGDSLTYNVFFGLDSIPSIIVSNISDTFYTPNNLQFGTTYYWRIKAYDEYPLSQLGSVWSFTTMDAPWQCGETLVDDRDGQIYETVQIGEQCWTAKNLNIGTRIASTTNQTNNGIIEKYCHSNIPLNCEIYGGLYQWYEMTNYTTNQIVQGICPIGWHIPSVSEFTILSDFLGGEFVAGGKMKETGTNQWSWPNTDATNSSGFTALPGGRCYSDGTFYLLGHFGYYWSIDQWYPEFSRGRRLNYNSAAISDIGDSAFEGQSVRCLRD